MQENEIIVPILPKKALKWLILPLVMIPLLVWGVLALTKKPPVAITFEGKSILEKPQGAIDRSSYQPLGFDVLAGFKYFTPNGGMPLNPGQKLESQMPKEISALDGRKVAVRGYMIPLTFEGTGVKRFVAAEMPPACCFGDSMKMNQWIDVAVAQGNTASYRSDEWVVVFGTLHVGEKVENGFVASVYRLDADDVILPGSAGP